MFQLSHFRLLAALLLAVPFTLAASPAERTLRIDSAKALSEALQSANPGTHLVLIAGEYRDEAFVFDGTQTPNGRGGTAEAPIVLTAEQPGEVVLTGRSTLRIAGQHMRVENLLFRNGSLEPGDAIVKFETSPGNRARHCLLTNSAIIDYNPEDPEHRYDWVQISGRFNRVENCEFSGMTHKGVQLVVRLDEAEAPARPVIRGNYFADRAPGEGNGYETIRIGTSTRSMLRTEALVEGNVFENLDGEIEVISNKSVGNVYRGNTFRGNNGQLTLRHGSDCLVEGNFFFGENKVGSGGVRVIGPGHTVIHNYFDDLHGDTPFRAAIALMNGVPDSPLNRYRPVDNLLVAHNTIVDCAFPVTIGVESSVGDTTIPPQTVTFAHNVIVGGSEPQFTFINQPADLRIIGQFSVGAAHGLPEHIDLTVMAERKGARDAEGIYRPAAPRPGREAAESPGTPEYRALTSADVGPSWTVR